MAAEEGAAGACPPARVELVDGLFQALGRATGACPGLYVPCTDLQARVEWAPFPHRRHVWGTASGRSQGLGLQLGIAVPSCAGPQTTTGMRLSLVVQKRRSTTVEAKNHNKQVASGRLPRSRQEKERGQPFITRDLVMV